MAETAFFQEVEGHVIAMDLPLPESLHDRVVRGTLRRVNVDGTPWTEEPRESGGSDLTNGVPPRPALNAAKAEWVGYAVSVLGLSSDDAEAKTKQDLIDIANQK